MQISRGASKTLAQSNFPFTDQDTGDALEKVKITRLPSSGELKLDGVAVSLNQEISKTLIDQGKLVT